MKIVAGTYVKNVRRVAWLEGKFPQQALVFEFEWNKDIAIVDCPDHDSLQALPEGTLIQHDGEYGCVLEYSFDDANCPLKSQPDGENFVFFLSVEDMRALQSAGRLVLRFEYASSACSSRIRRIVRDAEVA